MTEQANPAFYYGAGPVHIYVRIPVRGLGPSVSPSQLTGKILFLGHCEEAPEPDFTAEYIPVHSSLSGPAVPDDEIYVGGKYELALDMTRFSFSVITLLKRFPMYGRGAPAGSETYLDRGRFVQAHGDSYELWLFNSFYGTPNAVMYPDMPIGYYYPAVRTGGVLPRNMSRDATKAHLALKPLSVRQGVTGGYLTYSQDPRWFQNLPLPG